MSLVVDPFSNDEIATWKGRYEELPDKIEQMICGLDDVDAVFDDERRSFDDSREAYDWIEEEVDELMEDQGLTEFSLDAEYFESSKGGHLDMEIGTLAGNHSASVRWDYGTEEEDRAFATLAPSY